jgi:hypothetical protein
LHPFLDLGADQQERDQGDDRGDGFDEKPYGEVGRCRPVTVEGNRRS